MNADGARNEEQQQDLQQRARPPEDQDGGDDHHHQQPPPPLRCPRCDSSNTKFCYYNNYSLSQPRYFCKACRRYWTQGGTLRSVPVGGGCRKAKRPRISTSSSSSSLSTGLIPRTGGLSTLSQSLIPAQPPRLPPPVDQPFGGSFYAGGSFLSTLAAMQTLPTGGVNQGATMMGGGRGRFGTNMALLHGVSFPPWRSPAPPPTHFIPPQQNLVLPGRFGSWSPRVINDGATSSSAAASSGLWSSSGAGGSDQTGSSFTPNQWSTDCNSRFNPSSD